jgi:hypothetical protein
LIWALRRRIDSVEEASVLRSVGRSAVAAAAAALLMLGGLRLVEDWLGPLLSNGLGRLVVLAGLSAAGVAIFVLVAAALKSPELAQVRSQLSRRFGRRAA